MVPVWQASQFRSRATSSSEGAISVGEKIEIEKKASELENDFRATLAQVVGGVVLLLGLYFTWQTVVSARIGQRTAEEKNYSENFASAVNLLGSEDMLTRIAGIYALQNIAKSSQKYVVTITEVLCSFLRSRSPNEGSNLEGEIKGGSAGDDVQSAINVLGHRDGISDETRPLNLKNVNLKGCDLSGLQLDGADLRCANLSGCMIAYTSLNGAYLFAADLSDAWIYGANFNKADLREANLNVRVFSAVNLYNAQIPENYPEAIVGDLRVRAMCIGVDHHSRKADPEKQREAWQKFLEQSRVHSGRINLR